jgi:hypothetical protein
MVCELRVSGGREKSKFPRKRFFARCRPARFTVSVSLSQNTRPKHTHLIIIFSMRHSALRIVRRGLATAAAHPPHAGSSTSHVTAATSAIPLSNVEAQWATLSPSEQTAVHQQLEELQRKDWKTLSLAEKKAGTSYTLLFFFPFGGRGWAG